jgi:hypothetical protein
LRLGLAHRLRRSNFRGILGAPACRGALVCGTSRAMGAGARRPTVNDLRFVQPMSRASRAILLSALAATLAACGSAASSSDVPPSDGDRAAGAEATGETAQAQTHTVPVGATDVTPFLGWGYDSASQNFTFGCVASDVTLHAGQPSAHLAFDTSLSQDKLETELGGDLDAKAHFGAWKVSASANFRRTATSDEYSISFVYDATYDFGVASLDSNTLHLTPPGTSAQNAGTWQTTCGDQAVTEINQGARFYLVMRIDFSSKEVKDEFAATVGAGGAFGSVTASMQNKADMFKGSSKVHLEVFQIGGDVTRISGVFGSPQSDGSLPAVQCDLGDLSKCMAFATTAVTYATDVNGTGTFPTQLSSHPADLSYVTEDWSSLGIQLQPDILTDELKSDRLLLRQYYDAHAEYLRRVERLLDNGFVSGPALQEMTGWQQTLTAQEAQFNDVVIACYDDIDQKNLATTVSECTTKVNGVAALPHPDPLELDTYGPEGGVVKRWVALGGSNGPLGNPISGFSTYGGTAWIQQFQGGAIIAQPGSGAWSVQGPIWAEIKPHQQTSDPDYVGFPTEEQHATPDGKGTMQTFTNGVVYSTPAIGTVAIPLGILTYLNAKGGVTSAWGYPSNDPLGGIGGHIYQNYPRGSFPAAIHYKPKIGAFSTIGAMYSTYKAMPLPTSNLGAPIEEEHSIPNAIVQHFEHGEIIGHNGFFPVYGSIFDGWSQGGDGNGYYGWPQEATTSAGCQNFDLGTFCFPVLRSKVTHAPFVMGAIRGKWFALGRETGTLGHPLTDENQTADGGGRASEFEGGAIVWRSTSGALWSPGDVYSVWVGAGSGSSCLGFPTGDFSTTNLVQYFQHGRIDREKPTDPRDHRALIAVAHCN